MKKLNIILFTMICSTLYAPDAGYTTSEPGKSLRPTDASKPLGQPSEMLNVARGQDYYQQLQQRGSEALNKSNKPNDVLEQEPESTAVTSPQVSQESAGTEKQKIEFASDWEAEAEKLYPKPSLQATIQGIDNLLNSNIITDEEALNRTQNALDADYQNKPSGFVQRVVQVLIRMSSRLYTLLKEQVSKALTSDQANSQSLQDDLTDATKALAEAQANVDWYTNTKPNRRSAADWQNEVNRLQKTVDGLTTQLKDIYSRINENTDIQQAFKQASASVAG